MGRSWRTSAVAVALVVALTGCTEVVRRVSAKGSYLDGQQRQVYYVDCQVTRRNSTNKNVESSTSVRSVVSREAYLKTKVGDRC